MKSVKKVSGKDGIVETVEDVDHNIYFWELDIISGSDGVLMTRGIIVSIGTSVIDGRTVILGNCNYEKKLICKDITWDVVKKTTDEEGKVKVRQEFYMYDLPESI